ncbi:MAG: pyridoxal phosphate-dependent aminotransferase family protein [Bacteroidota bacterium]|nr:pyridoxal phosphate-dependent aminotransferase family protein [Bacteroidota bacterium]
MDLFEKLISKTTPLGQYKDQADGYYTFPKLEGEISPHMMFQGHKVLTWSLNNYIGLANHPEVRKADADAAKDWGLAYPMGARIMSGQTSKHQELENGLAEFVFKNAGYLLNYGYQGMVSIIDAMVDRKDVIVYDAESHACILDGLRLHMGKRFVYGHNDMDSLRKQLKHAKKITDKTGGGILVITEGVFGMSGDLGKLDEITAIKEEFEFRILVDDAHGFGTMGATGAGTGEHFNCQDKVDVYFGTFAKSMAGIGAFVAADKEIIDVLRYNMRSQIYAKSLPMPMVVGALKRLELLKNANHLREDLWKIVRALQDGLKAKGFDLGKTNSPVTPVFFKGQVAQATNVLLDLRENYHIFCSIVIYPVVPKGVIMLRLIPTADHTLEDVEYTIKAFSEVKEKLDTGKYTAEQVTKMTE